MKAYRLHLYVYKNKTSETISVLSQHYDKEMWNVSGYNAGNASTYQEKIPNKKGKCNTSYHGENTQCFIKIKKTQA